MFSCFSSITYSLEIGGYHGYSVCWFVTLYIVGNYIFRYVNHLSSKNKLYIYFVLLVILLEKSFLFYADIPHLGVLERVRDVNNILYSIASILLFTVLVNIRLENRMVNNAINIIHISAQSVLEIYLVHMQYDLKFYLWKIDLSFLKFSNEINVIVFASFIFIILLLIILGIKYIWKIVIDKWNRKFIYINS